MSLPVVCYKFVITCLVVLCSVAQTPASVDFLRAFNMLKNKYRIQKKDDSFRHQLDLRGHRIFHSNPLADCCPTTTHLTELKRAVNAQGVVLELFHTREFSQKFYETLCHKNHHNATCQFIDRRFRDRAKCRQQYSYVYALGRTYGNIEEDFKIDYVRVPSGCKCEVSFEDEFDGR